MLDVSDRLAYRVPEFARTIGVSDSYAWKLISEGRIPVVRIGRVTLVKREHIDRLLTQEEEGVES